MSDISVVVPFYEGQHLLIQCLRRINSQSLTPHEVIVVNDGKEILDLHSEPYKFRLTVFNNAVNKGASASRNIGVKLAQGNWIAFCDHDDMWLPSKLEKQIEYMNSSDVITCNALVRNGKKITLRKTLSPNQKDVLELLLRGWTAPNTSSLLIKKSLFDTIGGFDDRLSSGQDHDLWFRIANHKAEVYYIDEPLYIFDNTPSNFRISSKVMDKLIDLDLIISKYSDCFSKTQALNFISYWEAYYFLQRLFGKNKYRLRMTDPTLFSLNVLLHLQKKLINKIYVIQGVKKHT